jgi:hypothetical protein
MIPGAIAIAADKARSEAEDPKPAIFLSREE